MKLQNCKYTTMQQQRHRSKNEVMRTIGDFCNKNQRDYYDVSNNICQLPTKKKSLIFQYAF